MKSCAHYSDPAACLEHQQVIADKRKLTRLPDKSMCASCRRSQPEKDYIESEGLLEKLRSAGW